MGLTFRRRVTWTKNDTLLKPDTYGVSVPPGLGQNDIRYPKFVDATTMMKVAPDNSTSSAGSLTFTEGLVKSNLDVSFANPATQWRRSPGPGAPDANHGPAQFQFTGGEVVLDLTLEIYILNTATIDPHDDLSKQIFARLYEHELLHVLDALDITNNWLPPRLNGEATVARYLVQGQPYTYGTARMGISELEQEFRTFVTDKIQTAIFNLWATESNRRQKLRDAPAEYKIVQDKVEDLRVRQTNRPHH